MKSRSCKRMKRVTVIYTEAIKIGLCWGLWLIPANELASFLFLSICPVVTKGFLMTTTYSSILKHLKKTFWNCHIDTGSVSLSRDLRFAGQVSWTGKSSMEVFLYQNLLLRSPMQSCLHFMWETLCLVQAGDLYWKSQITLGCQLCITSESTKKLEYCFKFLTESSVIKLKLSILETLEFPRMNSSRRLIRYERMH